MITGISWFAVIYIFGFGFLIGIITSGFIISDWLGRKVKAIEDWFAMRKSMKLTEEEKKFFEGIQEKYIKQIKRWEK
jgi:hypothetical protein